MHVLFVHQNFPAQFGHLARCLVARGHRATFLSERPSPKGCKEIEYRQYKLRGGATTQTHYCSRSFENAIWRCHAVYDAVRKPPAIHPDLIVAHSGFGSSLFLRELLDAPIINYFEYYYHAHESDLSFRPDFPATTAQRLRALARNAMILLDLENCTAGYSPTEWQRSRIPTRYGDKVSVIHDGIDTEFWRPFSRPDPRRLGREYPPDVSFVTYVSRGFESMRGFDIFMRAARLVCLRRSDIVFLVVGRDRGCYGSDDRITGCRSFKQWVLSQADYDTSRFLFLGRLSARQLVEVFALADAHVYLTVPFVLSWSLLNAMACGVPVIASHTDPVQEVICDGNNGWLVEFFDIEALAERIMCAVDHRRDLRETLGRAGRSCVEQRYSVKVCFPRLLGFFKTVCGHALQATQPSG